MDSRYNLLNEFLVDVFHEILKTEEACLTSGEFRNLSLREMHIIEEVCLAHRTGSDNRATAIANAQRITAGTLTTSINQLEKKGYLRRQQDHADKRIIRILPTPLGLQANAFHLRFHHEMVNDILSALNDQETAVLLATLAKLKTFFADKYQQTLQQAQQVQP